MSIIHDLHIGGDGINRVAYDAWSSQAADLDAAAATCVNHSRGASDLGGGRLVVSSIYRWYREDFGGSDDGVLAHLERFAQGSLAAAIRADHRFTETLFCSIYLFLPHLCDVR